MARSRPDREAEVKALADLRARQAALLRLIPDYRHALASMPEATVHPDVERDALANRLQRILLALQAEKKELQ